MNQQNVYDAKQYQRQRKECINRPDSGYQLRCITINIGIPIPGFGHKEVPYSKTNGSAAAKDH
jgi:hypothetical protein